jgi:tetratricopeptide (TPR) repeat protein
MAHLLLARVLAPRSPAQARLEYRLAMEAPELIGEVLSREGPRMVGGYYDAMELLPAGDRQAAILEGLSLAVGARLPATQVRLDAEIVARTPAAFGPTVRSAEAAVLDVEATGGAPWCEGAARDACLHDALAQAVRVQRLDPSQCAGFALGARARVAAGDAAGGVTELEHAADVVADRVGCLEQVVAIARSARLDDRAELALQAIAVSGCSGADACITHLVYVAGQYETMGQPSRALVFYKRALERSPDDTLLGHVASVAASLGLHVEAAQDYDKLARRHPDEARWREAAEAEHQAAMRAAVRL